MKVSRLVAARPRWFTDTINFACTGCGKCCEGRTNVFVNQAEISELASFLGLASNKEFKKKYMRDEVSLKNDPSGTHCVFLKDNNCSVYNVRPTQCRTYPYWSQHVLGRAEWEAEATRCEGMGILSSPVPMQTAADVANRKGCTSAANSRVHSGDLLTNLTIHAMHDRGRGPEWTYDVALELLRESEGLQSVEQQGTAAAEATSSSLMDGLEDELFDKYHSNIVFENSLLRVVDLTVTESPVSTSTSAADADGRSAIATAADPFEGWEDQDTVAVTVTRRLEFKASPQHSKSEIQLVPVVGHFGMYRGQRFQQYRADHSTLKFAAHKVIASECVDFVRNGGCINSDVSGSGSSSTVVRPLEVAVIGAGGCTLPCHLIDTLGSEPHCPRVVVDAVDRERDVLLAARAYFGAGEYEDNGDLSVHVADGLNFLYNRSMSTLSQGNLKQLDRGSDSGRYSYSSTGSNSGRGYDIIILDMNICSIGEKGEKISLDLETELHRWAKAIAWSGRRGGAVYMNVCGSELTEETTRVLMTNNDLFMEVRVIDIAATLQGEPRNTVITAIIK